VGKEEQLCSRWLFTARRYLKVALARALEEVLAKAVSFAFLSSAVHAPNRAQIAMHEQQSARAFNSHAAWVHNLRRSYEERRNSALSVEESSRDEDMAFEDSLSRASYTMPGVDASELSGMVQDFDRAVDLDEIDGPVYRGGIMPAGGAFFDAEVYDEAPVYRSFDLAGVVGDAPALAPSPEAFDNVWRQSMPPLVERQTAFRR